MEPSLISLLPPLLAIGSALLFRHVVLALLLGVYSGALLLNGWHPITAFTRTLDHFIVNAVIDPGHTMILLFTIALGGMVGVLTANGGTAGLVERLSRRAVSARGGQWTTMLLGIAIFFDDYANCLLVGNAMRPITDRMKISREKLAFIVDATAAPVAAIALSTWTGYELGVIGDSLAAAQVADSAFHVFIASIPSRFYPLLMLWFVLLMIWRQRDFGPMLRAEIRARTEGKLLRDGAEPACDLSDLDDATHADRTSSLWNAVIPVVTVVVVTIIGFFATGRDALAGSDTPPTWLAILSEASANKSLLWGAITGSCVAIVLSLGQRLLTIQTAIDAWIRGARSMVLAVIILTLAWSIGAVTKEVQTAEYLVGLLGNALAPQWIPLATFLIAGAASFATGTSWGTMAIFMPIVVPLTVTAGVHAGLTPGELHPHLLTSVSAVLAGAIFGDHCSPISDTTVLSSMATACDHVDHVRTQLPYAFTVGGIAIVCGYIPTALGLSPWIGLGLGVVGVYVVIQLLGKHTT